jgi:hypothetical protein
LKQNALNNEVFCGNLQLKSARPNGRKEFLNGERKDLQSAVAVKIKERQN